MLPERSERAVVGVPASLAPGREGAVRVAVTLGNSISAEPMATLPPCSDGEVRRLGRAG